MPSKNIVDFANQVKSYALGIKDQQVLGAWNLFNNTAVSQTVANVPITVNADKTMLLNGTATGNIRLNLGSVTLKAGTYYLSGGANSDFYLNIINTAINSTDYNGTEFTVTEETTYNIQLVENGTKTANNLVVKPMISIQPNQPYVPYAMTNKELSEVKVVNASYTGVSSTIKDISLDVQRVGKVVQFAIYFVTNTSVNAGSTAQLTLVNCPLPSFSGMRIIGFSGTYELIGWIESTGIVKIRFFGNTNEGASIVLSGTYLTND